MDKLVKRKINKVLDLFENDGVVSFNIDSTCYDYMSRQNVRVEAVDQVSLNGERGLNDAPLKGMRLAVAGLSCSSHCKRCTASISSPAAKNRWTRARRAGTAKN